MAGSGPPAIHWSTAWRNSGLRPAVRAPVPTRISLPIWSPRAAASACAAMPPIELPTTLQRLMCQLVEHRADGLCQSLRTSEAPPVSARAERVEVDRVSLELGQGFHGLPPELPAAEPWMQQDHRLRRPAGRRRSAMVDQPGAADLNRPGRHHGSETTREGTNWPMPSGPVHAPFSISTWPRTMVITGKPSNSQPSQML